MKIELITDKDCPNVSKARANLMRAFSATGASARWREWDRDDPAAPAYVADYGSPTILVDGRDVADSAPADGNCCRVYRGEDGSLSGVPSVELIASRLAPEPQTTSDASATKSSIPDGRAQSFLAALPGVFAAVLPKVTCPACWPAYAGILSVLGLGFLMETRWLLPISIALLSLAVVSLAWRAERRRGYGPAVVSAAAAIAIVASKFAFDNESVTYGAAGIMLLAAVWNLWPRRDATRACSACTTPESLKR